MLGGHLLRQCPIFCGRRRRFCAFHGTLLTGTISPPPPAKNWALTKQVPSKHLRRWRSVAASLFMRNYAGWFAPNGSYLSAIQACPQMTTLRIYEANFLLHSLVSVDVQGKTLPDPRACGAWTLPGHRLR